jgi:uncharacterized protein (TIGR03067 family)
MELRRDGPCDWRHFGRSGAVSRCALKPAAGWKPFTIVLHRFDNCRGRRGIIGAVNLLRSVAGFLGLVTAFLVYAAEPSTSPAPPAPPTIDPATQAALPPLQGTWEGAVVGDEAAEKITITINGNAFRFHRDTNFWFDTTITLPAGTAPKQLQATIRKCAPGQENSVGKVVGAIYKLEGEWLTVASRGDGGEDLPKTFADPADKGLTVYRLRKVPVSRKE